MRALTTEEVSTWLSNHGIQEAPCSISGYEQVAIPPRALSQSHLVQNLLSAVDSFNSALLHITDWAHYRPQQMAAIMAIRASQGEDRWLIESPGHYFGSDERDLLSGMFALSMHYGWTSYLHLEKGPTFLCWEGELLDVWMPEGNYEPLLEVIDEFGKCDS